MGQRDMLYNMLYNLPLIRFLFAIYTPHSKTTEKPFS